MLRPNLARWSVCYAPSMTLKTSLADQLDTWLRHGPRTQIVKSTDGAVFEVDTTDLIQRYLYLFGV